MVKANSYVAADKKGQKKMLSRGKTEEEE